MINPLTVATQGVLRTPLLVSVQGLVPDIGGLGSGSGIGSVFYRIIYRMRRGR